jgi:two-component system, cell cycle response regulator
MTCPYGSEDKLPLTVLCVDDEDAHLDILRRFITPMVETVFTAGDGASGYELFQEHRPDLIISDIMMPKVSGLELCQLVREHDTKTKLILQTSAVSTDFLARAIEAGVDQFLPKPVTRDKLVSSLSRCYAAIAVERQAIREHALSRVLAAALVKTQTEVLVLSTSGIIEFVNHSGLCGIFGDENDPVGRSIAVMDVEADLVQEVARVAACGRQVELEVKARSKETSPRWLRMKIWPFSDHGETKLCLNIDDITDKKNDEYKLRYQATHDKLTGLYNRTYFEEELYRVSIGRNFPVSIVIADVDRLKLVNDRYGHEAGDHLIRKAAQHLKEAFRAEDVVARIGGDEFCVILPGVTGEVALECICRSSQTSHVLTVDGTGIDLAFSFGCATAERPGQVKETLKLADSRMYQQKTARRSREIREEFP